MAGGKGLICINELKHISSVCQWEVPAACEVTQVSTLPSCSLMLLELMKEFCRFVKERLRAYYNLLLILINFEHEL